MILTCPDCATRYMTKPEAIGPNGRTVRCANCSATWFVSSEQAVEAAAPATPARPDVASAPVPAPADVEPLRRNPRAIKDPNSRSVSDPVNAPDDFAAPSAASVMREQTEQKRAGRRLMSVGAMWLVTLALLSAGALSAYVFRQDIVDTHPKSATLYNAFGVQVAKGGLVFGRVITRSAFVEGKPTLIVEGEVHNPGREVRDSRLVQLSLHGPSGQVLTQWQVEMPEATIAKGETLSFATQYPNQPVDAVTLKYVFSGDTVDTPTRSNEGAGGDRDIQLGGTGDRAALSPQE